MTRNEINAFGDAIKARLLGDESAILVAIGAAAPSPDCRVTSALATVVGRVGKVDQSFTSNALNLDDAISLARGKLADARTAFERAKDKAKNPEQPQ
jgi:hypothetical protein